MNFIFKLRYSLRQIDVADPNFLPFTMQVDGECPHSIELHYREFADPKIGRQLCCVATYAHGISDERAELLKILEKGRLPMTDPPTVELPVKTPWGDLIDENGNITPKHAVWMEHVPETLKELFRDARRTARSMIINYIQTAMWMQLVSGPHDPFSSVDSAWSFDGDTWNPTPSDTRSTARQLRGIRLETKGQSAIAAALSSKTYGRLGHELIREALENVNRSPRSALLVGITALETGVKQYLAYLVPGSGPILENIPSSPILKILQEILPALHKNGSIESKRFPLDASTKECVKKWISVRNRVAHGNASVIDSVGLMYFLIQVRKILYCLDECSGHTWATAFADDQNPERFSA